VVYNLKYEQGAILQNLPPECLEELRTKGKTEHGLYIYKVVGYKNLRISRGKNSVTFWDMWTFFNMSLASAARQFTNLQKIDQDTTLYTPEYIRDHLDDIKTYCIRDAVITAALFQVLKGMCAKLDISPTTFYSIATIGYKYARENTDYQTVNHFWKQHREVLEAACDAYSGGKFEVTTRGKGNFYEYDINSAYAYEIANLVNLSKVRVYHSNAYRPGAAYGFVKVDAWLPGDTAHPIAIKRGTVNIFPAGRLKKWVTKAEYEYLLTIPDAEITIKKGIWLYPRWRNRPYLTLIKRLYHVKAEAKAKKDKEMYHFSKILMNSLYGKFVQLIKRGDKIEASTCWHPIYGAIITANVRIRIARLQAAYPSIVAVHTDSVISRKKLPLPVSDELGDWSATVHGLGIIIGCGFYQIADKVRVRGFPFQTDIMDLLNKSPPLITIPDTRAITWRQVPVNHWDTGLVNRFIDFDKVLNINFDTKRVWSEQWKGGDDARERVLDSVPFIVF